VFKRLLTASAALAILTFSTSSTVIAATPATMTASLATSSSCTIDNTSNFNFPNVAANSTVTNNPTAGGGFHYTCSTPPASVTFTDTQGAGVTTGQTFLLTDTAAGQSDTVAFTLTPQSSDALNLNTGTATPVNYNAVTTVGSAAVASGQENLTATISNNAAVKVGPYNDTITATLSLT
jgi:spore coat protein U-like protein